MILDDSTIASVIRATDGNRTGRYLPYQLVKTISCKVSKMNLRVSDKCFLLVGGGHFEMKPIIVRYKYIST